jgi:hypothetical protein
MVVGIVLVLWLLGFHPIVQALFLLQLILLWVGFALFCLLVRALFGAGRSLVRSLLVKR